MARVAFLLPPSSALHQSLSWRFIRHLADNQHEIKVITGRSNPQPDEFAHTRIQWAQALKYWQLWELPNLVRGLWDFQPEIIHLLIDQKVSRLSLVNFALPALKAIWRTPVVTSIFSATIPEGTWQNDCDLLTVGSLRLAQFPPRTLRRTKLEYAPPPIVSVQPSERPRTGLRFFIAELPSTSSERQELWRNLILGLAAAPEASVSLAASWSDLAVDERRILREQLLAANQSERWHFTRELRESEFARQVIESDLLLLAGSNHESLQTSVAIHVALAHHVPVQISTDQKNIHPRLAHWPDELVFPQQDWPARFRRCTASVLNDIREQLTAAGGDNRSDLAANQISRAYSRLLAAIHT